MPIEMTERLEEALEAWSGNPYLGVNEELLAAYREARDAPPKKRPEAHKCPGWPCEICSGLGIGAYGGRFAHDKKETPSPSSGWCGCCGRFSRWPMRPATFRR